MLEQQTVTCPNCDAEDLRGARFCPHCGAGIGGNGLAPAVHAPLIRLLTEVADLQKDLLRQFERGRRIHARQFERAIAAQTESLQRTLDHHSNQSERLQAWQRWTAGLAAAVVLLVVLVVQFAA
ncbi:MAG: zinc ribbon domain-containing protein [Dehalococcoidia bacterium]